MDLPVISINQVQQAVAHEHLLYPLLMGTGLTVAYLLDTAKPLLKNLIFSLIFIGLVGVTVWSVYVIA